MASKETHNVALVECLRAIKYSIKTFCENVRDCAHSETTRSVCHNPRNTVGTCEWAMCPLLMEATPTEKVLVHNYPALAEVHLVQGSFIEAKETVCGERLHACSTVHIINDEIHVTCIKCSNWLILKHYRGKHGS